MIYFVCPDVNFPTGGVKVIYRYVEMLNKNGRNAAVLHKNNKADGWEGKPTWFQYDANLVPILYSYVNGVPNKIKVEADDWFIVPEGYGADIINKFSKLNCNNKTVLAQSWSYIIPSFAYNQNDQVVKNWKDAGFKKVIVTTELIKTVVKHLFRYDDSEIFKVQPFIESEFNSTLTFGKVKKEIEFYDKDLIILFNPRKHPNRYQEVFAYLSHMHPHFMSKWRLQPIDNKSQEEVISELKRSAIFLTCSHEEGFGMPILEAFGTNTISVGNVGLGAEEFFKNGFEDVTNSSFMTAKKLFEAMKVFNDNNEDEWNRIINEQKNIFKLYNKNVSEEQLVSIFL